MRVILHIGQHKTGSKALQSTLYANREWLSARGIAYPVDVQGERRPRPFEMNHHWLFGAVREEADSSLPGPPQMALPVKLRSLLESVRATAHTVILSAEDLFDMHTAHEDRFVPERVAAGSARVAGVLAELGVAVRVVVYLRRQDHLLAAHYAQYIKGTNRNDLSFTAFKDLFRERLDFDALLRSWEVAFGIDALSVRAYEPSLMPDGVIGDVCARVLDLPLPPLTEPYPDDLEAFNITPSRDWLDYMRLLNRRSAQGLPVRPREAVLEAAFRGRDLRPAGVAAWLSPGERATLLERHDAGNRRIAERHGLGSELFRERPPREGDPWSPPPPLSRERFEQLDARVRNVMESSHPKRRRQLQVSMLDSVDLTGILAS